MNSKNILITLTALGTLFALPLGASAHERDLFSVGGTEYLFVVGSIGEPIVVDDKTAVDLRVLLADPKDKMNSTAKGAKPVEGLESTLKVELQAGDKKKVFDLKPAYKDPGAYRAVFFPTIQTALTYRVFGILNDMPIDVTFNCNASEGAPVPDDNTPKQFGPDVVRMEKKGGFGCPIGKESLGFPEAGMTMVGLHENLHNEMNTMMSSMDHHDTETLDQSGMALAFGIFGTILGALAFMKARKKA